MQVSDVYHDDFDRFCCSWLKELAADGHIPRGRIDGRDIRSVEPDDLRDHPQCHFFAGVGGWAYALRLAGWPDDMPVWTGSCPCEPFSNAGKHRGVEDPRHLWPDWFRLIRQCRPPTIFGEQVESAVKHGWLDLVFDDLEEEGYACAAAVLPASCVGSPHIRHRIFWVGSRMDNLRDGGRQEPDSPPPLREACDARRPACGLGDPQHDGLDGVKEIAGKEKEGRVLQPQRPACGVEHAAGGGLGGGQPGEVGQPAGLPDEGPCTGGVVNPHGSGRDADGGEREGGGKEPQDVLGTGHWSPVRWLPCRDGKQRPVPVEPSLFPLAHGVPNRVDLLRGAGGAIVPQVAAEFVRAYMEVCQSALRGAAAGGERGRRAGTFAFDGAEMGGESMRDQRRAGICEDPECPRHRMSPSIIKGQNPDTGLDECMTCYPRRRRREQGYVPPDAVKLNKRVAKSRNKIEEGLLDLGFSPAEAAETISEIADRCPALYRFIHGLGPSDDVDMPTDVNVNIQDEPEQDEEEVDVNTEHDVNVNAAVGDKNNDALTSVDVDKNSGVNVNGRKAGTAKHAVDVETNPHVNVNEPALSEEGVAAIREAIESEPEVDVDIVQDVNVNGVGAAIKRPETPELSAVEPAQKPESQEHERSLPMHEKKYFTNLLAKIGKKAQRRPGARESSVGGEFWDDIKEHTWSEERFGQRGEFLRTLTWNFLFDTLKLLAEAGKAIRLVGSYGRSAWMHPEGVGAARTGDEYSTAYRCPMGHIERDMAGVGPLPPQRPCGGWAPEKGKELDEQWASTGVYADRTRIPRCQETALLLTKKEKRKIDTERRELLKKGTQGEL